MTARILSYWTAIFISILCSALFFVSIRSEDLPSQDLKVVTTTVVPDTPIPDLSDIDVRQKSTIEIVTPDVPAKTDYKVVSSFEGDDKKTSESSSNDSDSTKFRSTEATKIAEVTSTKAQHTTTTEPHKSSEETSSTTVKKMGNDSNRYVVRAQPKVVTQGSSGESSTTEKKDEVITIAPIINMTSSETRSHKAEEESAQEDIPSFSEWAEKRLAEVEQSKGENGNASTPGRSGGGTRHRSKNYASVDCGAKVVATNPEASSTSSLLSPSRDEYLLNACGSKIWFVVELCEAIQAKKIELANFELFSSSPKEFSAFVSDRFPTRDWQSVGQFVAADEKTIQTFDLNPQIFGKFIKIEFFSHYGSEHYCPVSLFRAYGTSEFEALETEDHASRMGSAPYDEDDDDDEDERLDAIRGDSPGNIFGSARDAVLSIVKKAAEVLVNKGDENNMTEFTNATVSQNISATINVSKPELCTSPSHIIVCDNCSDSLFDQVFQLLSCKDQYLRNLLYLSFIHEVIKDGDSCSEFGLDFANQRIGAPFPRRPNFSEQSRFLGAIFPRSYIAALCNVLAVIEKKVVLNVTCHNCTSNISGENFPTPPDIQETLHSPTESTCVATESPIIDSESHFITIPTISLDVSSNDSKSETLDIKPTKTLPTKETHLDPSHSTIPQVDKVVTETSVHRVSTVTAIPTSTTKEIILDSEKSEATGDLSSEESLDKLFSELLDTTTIPTSSATTSPPPGVVQKESVFVRLSNRIKMLERNMSLSGQYLEELSRRYKKQMEEMQRAFNRTLAAITDESRKGEERERLQTAELAALHLKLENLSQIVERLVLERDSWQSRLSSAFQHLLFTAVEVCIFALLLLMCRRRREDMRRDSLPVIPISRRRSVEGVIGYEYVDRSHQRRPSEEALNIIGTYNHLLLKDGVDVEDGTAFKQENKKKKRKKKDSLPKSMSGDQKERRVSEIAANCDETETGSSQVRRASTSDEVFCDHFSVDRQSDESSHIEILTPTNGEARSSRSEDKVYRLSHEADVRPRKVTYPTFLKTAISSRNLRRSESCRQPRLKNDNWEWYSSVKSPSIVENGHDSCGLNGTDSNNEVPKKTSIKKPGKKFFY